MVIWIIGLSGCGKTTLAEEVVRLARESRHPTVLLDGDKIRELFKTISTIRSRVAKVMLIVFVVYRNF